ncbi:MAG TPA: hypothetical protein VJZ27_20860, partial [Aggregatilineales bacterium]|nr:hypothetical protein [Aggregatilineales bacterium]
MREFTRFQFRRENFRLLLGLCVLLGILLRLWLIIRSGWRMDYDEAMLGLLGRRVLRGEFMVFIPAQPTLGAVEAYLLAPIFALFGAGAITFRFLSLIMSGLYIVTTGLIGRAAFDWRVGVMSGLLAALAPPYMLIVGLKTWGSTIETIVFGNLLLLCAGHILESSGNPRRQKITFALMGLTAGLMFWSAWLGFYYFLPVAVLLLWKGREKLYRYGWIAFLAFFIGSLPFWIYNLQHDMATFQTVREGSRLSVHESLRVMRHFGRDMMPRLVTGDEQWEIIPVRLLPVLLYGTGIFSLFLKIRRNSTSLHWMLVIFICVVPLLYLNSSYSRNALNPWGVDATGRYVVMLHTV